MYVDKAFTVYFMPYGCFNLFLLLQFLKELICYLDEWRATVAGRSGFDDDQKQHKMLSAANDNGIRITGVCV